MEKSIIILFIYDNLINGKSVNAGTCMKKFNISLSTFYRYINTLRAFVWEKNLSEIVYDAKNMTYKLIRANFNAN